MRRLVVLLPLLVLLAVAGCGGRTGQVPPSASRWGDCDMAAFDDGGRVVVHRSPAEHDIWEVRLYGPGRGPCANGLVARFGGGVEGADVSGMDLDPGSVRLVRLRGTDAPVLVAASRPTADARVRTHLFGAYGGGRLTEVLLHGSPLLPVVATDGTLDPATATCEPDGHVAVWTATAHQPPGIVLAWDVRKTVYRIDGGTADAISSTLAEDGAADPLMRKKMPQLFQPDAFLADC
jgi:hypothetical protein